MTVYLVTDDAAMLSGDPKRMHPTDLAMLVGRTPVTSAHFREMVESEQTFEQSPEEPGLAGAFPLPPGGLQTMAKAADATSKDFMFVAHAIMSQYRAEQIRELRVDRGQSWRAIASEVYADCEHLPGFAKTMRKTWWPPSNQIMGMALCEVAAKRYNEDYMTPPWNDLTITPNR